MPADDSGSLAHTAAAGTAFVALAVWPALAGHRDAPWPLRPAATVAATVALVGLLGWFADELSADAGRVGLAERATAGAQALWPMVAAWGSRRWNR